MIVSVYDTDMYHIYNSTNIRKHLQMSSYCTCGLSNKWLFPLPLSSLDWLKYSDEELHCPPPTSHPSPLSLNSRFTQSSRSGVQETLLSSICREIKVDMFWAGINQWLFPIVTNCCKFLLDPTWGFFYELLNVTPSNPLIIKVLHVVREVGSHHHGNLFAFSHAIKNTEVRRSLHTE